MYLCKDPVCPWMATLLYSSVKAIHTTMADLSFLLPYGTGITRPGPDHNYHSPVTLTTCCTTSLLQRHVVLEVSTHMTRQATLTMCPKSLKYSLTADINGSQTEAPWKVKRRVISPVLHSDWCSWWQNYSELTALFCKFCRLLCQIIDFS